jgi:arylsulfatase A-like enzyme
MSLQKKIYYPYIGLWYTVTSRHPIGKNIYEKDWDVAIILDTCRVDALRELESEYEFINGINSIWSVGSSTPEWLINTFTTEWADKIRKTTRISANGFDEYILVQRSLPPEIDKAPFSNPSFSPVDHTEFERLEIMYKGKYHSERLGTVPPEHVTKRGIAVGRNTDWEKLMLHYIQPHAPYISQKAQSDSSLSEVEDRPMWALRSGLIKKGKAWEMYLDNLRLVLDSVKELINNIDAENIVITADHGESFGEYGGKFGHIDGYLSPEVKRVPWVSTSGSDQRTTIPEEEYQGDIYSQGSQFEKRELENHLKDLGYF